MWISYPQVYPQPVDNLVAWYIQVFAWPIQVNTWPKQLSNKYMRIYAYTGLCIDIHARLRICMHAHISICAHSDMSDMRYARVRILAHTHRLPISTN